MNNKNLERINYMLQIALSVMRIINLLNKKITVQAFKVEWLFFLPYIQ